MNVGSSLARFCYRLFGGSARGLGSRGIRVVLHPVTRAPGSRSNSSSKNGSNSSTTSRNSSMMMMIRIMRMMRMMMMK